MIENRVLTLDDYLAILKRHRRLILLLVLLGPALGFLGSYAFTAKYTSQSLILVEAPKVAGEYVRPLSMDDLAARIETLKQQALSQTRLQATIDRVGLAHGKNTDELMDTIRLNFEVEPIQPEVLVTRGKRHRSGSGASDVPGLIVSFTAPNAADAQKVCNELTSVLLEENLKSRAQVAQTTTEFLGHQLEEAKRSLDEQDAKLAAFKRRYLGQLPGDEDQNLKLLTATNSQLDATTQALNRAQQDKAYSESMLAQQLAAWKSTQGSASPESLDQQLSQRQAELLALQGRYTADHPDVIKAKGDIAELKKQLNEMNAARPEAGAEAQRVNLSEPAEIRQLRVQIHQYDSNMTTYAREQRRLQSQIAVYQGRMALSPTVEEQYKQLTRDYETAQKFYGDLLAKKSESEMTKAIESGRQGEQLVLLNQASLPDAPSFPNRLLFAGGGLGAGLALGLGMVLWFELRDKSIRTQQDAEAVLELPVLASLPWVQENRNSDGNGPGRRGGRLAGESGEEESSALSA